MKNRLKEQLKQIYRNILKHLPMKVVLNIENFRGYHKLVNFKKPKYFGEKIQYLKVYGNMEQYKKYVDKYAVRRFVEKTIGKEYLIPLIKYYENLNDIDYNYLPEQFAIKLNYGSGYNIIVDDKRELDISKTNKTLQKWLKQDYYKIKKEYQYKNIPKKILIEKYIVDKNGELNDYKFFCFNGKVKMFKVDFDRFTSHKCNYYDENCKFLNIHEGNYNNDKDAIVLPNNIKEMIDIAEKISMNFNFVRVDLYDVDGKIYFGELTFTPSGGLNPFKPLDIDLKIASWINLKLKKIAVLVSTLNCNDITKLLDDLNINSDCIVVNQCDIKNEEMIDRKYKGHRLRIINSPERGLSNSRNKAIKNIFSDIDIIVFADDDERLSNDYASKIIEKYNSNLIADGIVFNVKRTNGNLNKKIGKTINQVNLFRACSVSLSFKYMSIKNIKFDNRFGTGSGGYVCGEENIFVSDCLKNKNKIYTSNYIMCELTGTRPSTWFNSIDEKLLHAKGACFKRIHRYLYPLFNLDFAIRKFNEYKCNFNFFNALKILFDGSNSFQS